MILKSVSKLLLPRLANFITSRISKVEAQFIWFWKEGQHEYTQKIVKIFVFPEGNDETELSPRRLAFSKFQI